MSQENSPLKNTYAFKKDKNHVIEKLSKLSQMLSNYTSKITIAKENQVPIKTIPTVLTPVSKSAFSIQNKIQFPSQSPQSQVKLQLKNFGKKGEVSQQKLKKQSLVINPRSQNNMKEDKKQTHKRSITLTLTNTTTNTTRKNSIIVITPKSRCGMRSSLEPSRVHVQNEVSNLLLKIVNKY